MSRGRELEAKRSVNAHYDAALAAAHSVHGDLGLPKLNIRPLHMNAKDLGGYLYKNATSIGIELDPDQKHPEFTALHEHGHHIDHQALGTEGYAFASKQGRVIQLMKAIHNTPEVKLLLKQAKRPWPTNYRRALNYLAGPEERFARACA